MGQAAITAALDRCLVTVEEMTAYKMEVSSMYKVQGSLSSLRRHPLHTVY
jgi:hypothetical protein